jgi:hypothetical protein
MVVTPKTRAAWSQGKGQGKGRAAKLWRTLMANYLAKEQGQAVKYCTAVRFVTGRRGNGNCDSTVSESENMPAWMQVAHKKR